MSRSSEYTYTPAWWVPGAHLQTLWGKLVRRAPRVETRVERWTTPDGDEVELRRLDPRGERAGAPRLLLLHGLEGTIDSVYLLGTLAQARTRGWAADVLIFRTCNGEMNRARRMYHSGETTDLDFVVRQLIARHPTQPLVAAGFSLGGNVLLKWLGEQGDAAPSQLVAAAAVSVPFDLERGSRHIERGFARIYGRHFLRTLRAKALAKLRAFPGLFDRNALERARTLFDFDDAVTAPVHGFLNASDYYSRSSSLGFLPRIRRPTLLLSARNDPFLPHEVLDSVADMARENANLHVEFHELGGHVGFVSGLSPFRPRYYAEWRVVDFLDRAVRSSVLQRQTLAMEEPA
ncbi:MAG TPA: hydrolase [Gemmatimonadaceae bacterium]|nr:hydrolase [Gemmatimonadaceae bacterium]